LRFSPLAYRWLRARLISAQVTQKSILSSIPRKSTSNLTDKDFVPLAQLEDLVFAGWDIFYDNAYEAACKAKVLEKTHLDPVKDFLVAICIRRNRTDSHGPRPQNLKR
jgi:hypothetical protein